MAITKSYLLSSFLELAKGTSGVNIRVNEPPSFQYIGTLTEDNDFGSVRQLNGIELDEKLVIIVASDDKLTIFAQTKDGSRMKFNEQVQSRRLNRKRTNILFR